MIELTREQKQIVNAAEDFFHSSTGAQHMCISGYAGTGKTTVMGSLGYRLLNDNPSLSIAWCAPTGKASSVLRTKLEDFGALNERSHVHTVHGHIYSLNFIKDGKYDWSKRTGKFPYDLIIVDEASMVTGRMFNDLLSFGKKVLFVGDAGQLPPVGDKPFSGLKDTEFKLTTVQRQALENPIIRVATMAHQGEPIPRGSIGENFCKVAPRSSAATSIRDMFLKGMLEKDVMILCARNKTRQAINRVARMALGFSGKLPNQNEKLLCLRNEHKFDVYNGQIVSVEDAFTLTSGDSCYALIIKGADDPILAYAGALHAQDGKEIRTHMAADAEDIGKCLALSLQDSPALFDFGYALSVHKSQGSEWDAVLLYDECMPQMTDEEYACWLYTGITRAKHKLCIIG